MKLAGGNNPCGEKEEDRDASGRLKIIPMAQKSKMGMNPFGRNNPCGTKDQDRDAFDRGKVIPMEQKSKLEMLINFQFDDRFGIGSIKFGQQVIKTNTAIIILSV